MDRRARSEPGSEAGSIKDAGMVYPVGSTPDLRIGPSNLPTPGPSTSRDRGSNGTQMPLSPIIHLTASCPRNTARHSVSDRIRSIFRTGKRQDSKPQKHSIDEIEIDENKSDWKSTTYATTKLALHMVRETSDAFPPLKAVAGGLSAILNHCDVLSVLLISYRTRHLHISQKTIACRQTIESLMPRIEGLVESLSAPVPQGEIKEEKRREVLRR